MPIQFTPAGKSVTRKTARWAVVTDTGSVLGHVCWMMAEYDFMPTSSTCFRPADLRAIAEFCDEQTAILKLAKPTPIPLTQEV